jgi:multiple sugar transport system ATP-binding protein
VAPPLELYERPANRFVGGFIGSPAMNFLPGKLTRQDGLMLACTDGTVWPLPADFSPPAELMDRNLILGIRPEHLTVGGDQPGVAAGLQVLESLGNETLAYFQVAGEPVTARYSGQLNAAIDDELNLSFAAEHIHLFGSDDQGINLLNKG